jgi:HEPN domain-containing protein
MLNIPKQIAYWRDSAEEDWAVAGELFEKRRTRHCLYMANMALEKTLKALVVRATAEVPPKTHNLTRLAELAGLNPPDEVTETLIEMNAFNIEGRYPELVKSNPTLPEARDFLRRTEVVLAWLKQQL